MKQCRICHATYERQRRHAQRQRNAGLAIQKSATAIARAPNLASVSTMLKLLVQQFGGPNQFYQYWFDEIERLKRKRRPTFRLLRFLEMLTNLEFLHDAEIHERRKQINSQEWRSALYAELCHLIEKHPEVVTEAAAKLGSGGAFR